MFCCVKFPRGKMDIPAKCPLSAYEGINSIMIKSRYIPAHSITPKAWERKIIRFLALNAAARYIFSSL